MKTCPYNQQPHSSKYSQLTRQSKEQFIDPQGSSKFIIQPNDRVVSAGSCFAQRITQLLQALSFNYLVTEPAPRFMLPKTQARYQYNVYSARYGNIYTPKQLLQLLQRAFGKMTSQHTLEDNSRYYDPFRPTVQPNGFTSESAMFEAQAQHLHCTKNAFEQMDFFIFTLGLTEAWRAKSDGAVFPMCPGCGVGTFSDKLYEFVNFDVLETTQDLVTAIEFIKAINPNANVILTVSPIPLAATFTDQHVIRATQYSKSVLRVAAEHCTQTFDHVDYFASYEVIHATNNQAQYFDMEQRAVTMNGLQHVLSLFVKHFTTCPSIDVQQLMDINEENIQCDEAVLMKLMREFNENNK